MKPDQSRRLSALLSASFGLTIVSFLAARAVSEDWARGIGEAATTISDSALPSNDLLAPVRSELRHIDIMLEGVELGTLGADYEHLRVAFDDARETIDRSWRSYMVLPVFPGEQNLQGAAETDMHEVDVSVDRVLQMLARNDRAGALAETESTRRAVARADGDVRAIAALNRRVAMDAADRIAELRSASHTWGITLDALSAFLSLVSAYFVIRVVRRVWVQSTERAAELEHFAGRVAHDIRGPLGTISLALELARRRTTDPQVAAILERGLRTLHRVAQLVDGMLVFAAAGKPFAGDRGANVREVVQGVIEDVRAEAEAKHITIEQHLPDSSLVAACSPGVLVSLTSNILVNAVKYMRDAPIRRIEVRAWPSARSVHVEVADTGPGIPARLRATIFDPHVRGEGTTATGFGLGLATVRRLAEAHGGSVGVHDNAQVGSVFWFELPQWREKQPRPRGAEMLAPRRPRPA